MTDLIPRDAAIAALDSHAHGTTTLGGQTYRSITLEVAVEALQAIPAIDPAAIRDAALREAALIAQNYHMNALEWAKKIRGLENHIGETDSLRIANDILALIGEANSMIGEKK